MVREGCIRIAPRTGALRCVVCHDGLDTSRVVCGACRAVFHVDCADRCVTLGCRASLRGDGYDPDFPSYGGCLGITVGLLLADFGVMLLVLWSLPRLEPGDRDPSRLLLALPFLLAAAVLMLVLATMVVVGLLVAAWRVAVRCWRALATRRTRK